MKTSTAFLVIGIVVVIGMVLVATATSVYPLVILGLGLVLLGLVGALIVEVVVTLRRIADLRLRKVSWALLVLFVIFYFLAAWNPSGGDLASSLYTNISAGCLTGFVVLIAEEYVRAGNSAR